MTTATDDELKALAGDAFDKSDPDGNLLDPELLWKRADDPAGNVRRFVVVPIQEYQRMVAAYHHWLAMRKPLHLPKQDYECEECHRMINDEVDHATDCSCGVGMGVVDEELVCPDCGHSHCECDNGPEPG